MKKLLINGKTRIPELPAMNFTLEHAHHGGNPSVILMATNEHGITRGILEIAASCRVMDTGYFEEMGFTLVESSFKK